MTTDCVVAMSSCENNNDNNNEEELWRATAKQTSQQAQFSGERI